MSVSPGSILLFLLVFSAVYYGLFIARAYRGLRSLPDLRESAPSRTVTVLIPARNEEATIGRCLDALIRQDYPQDKIEFLVIDDGSTDRTAAIVSEYRRRDGRVNIVQLGPDTTIRPSRKRGRKPEALAAGIARSRSDIIITTDSDCLPSASWVRVLTSYLRDGVVYAVGPVLERPGHSFFTRLRALEVLGLIAITAGRIGIGKPVNGHGGNTAFFREVYEKTGGFDLKAVKSDEETLMHETLSHGIGAVGFAATPLATVYTSSPPTFANYWNQRLRWGSMHGRFRSRTILLELMLLYCSLLFPLVTLLATFRIPELLPALLGSFLLKVLTDLSILRLAGVKFGQGFSLITFVVGELLHSSFIVAVSTVAQILPYRWKDRKVLAVDSRRRS